MGQLKAGEVESFVRKPNNHAPTILIYGPDSGLVSERADEIASASGVDLKDPFLYIRMNADDVAADPNRLADEAHTVGMFGGTRLIRISGSTRRDLAKAVAPVLSEAPQDCWILIEAGELRKTSGLRKAVEKSPKGLALPCYQDNDAALDGLIQTEIIAKGFNLSNDDRLMLRSMLGADRRASRNELQKLALFAHGKSEITSEDIRKNVGEVSAFILDDIIDSALSGNVSGLEADLIKAESMGTSPDMIVSAAARLFETLHLAKSRMDKTRQNAGSMFRQIRPPLHFSRERTICAALNAWESAALMRGIERLRGTVLECRKNDGLSWSLAKTALLAIALEAKASSRRQSY